MAATFKFYNTDCRPTTDLQLDLGTASLRWNNIYGLNLHAGGLTYTWPTSHGTNLFLKNNGSGTLSWADPTPPFVTMNKWSVDT